MAEQFRNFSPWSWKLIRAKCIKILSGWAWSKTLPFQKIDSSDFFETCDPEMESTQWFINVVVTCWGSYCKNIRTYIAWYQGIIFSCSTQNRISPKNLSSQPSQSNGKSSSYFQPLNSFNFQCRHQASPK